MSIEIRVTFLCDTCGVTSSDTGHAIGHVKSTIWKLRRLIKRYGWQTVRRGWHPPTHYCSACLDLPMKPVPRKRRAEAP